MKHEIKKTLLAAIVTAFSFASLGAGEGASQKWVKQYVEQYVSNAIAKSATTLAAEAKSSSSNGVNIIEVGDGGNRATLTWEDATVYALEVTNATDAVAEYGITNGFTFVWDGAGSFVNGNGELVKITSGTNKTCYTWHDVDSVRTNSLDAFVGKFAVGGVMIQPSVALEITNALTTAETEGSAWRLLSSFLVATAYAEVDPRSTPGYWVYRDAEHFQKYNVKLAANFDDGNAGVIASLIDVDKGNINDVLQQMAETASPDTNARNVLVALQSAWEAATLANNIAIALSAQDWTEKDAEVSDTESGVSTSGTVSKTAGSNGGKLKIAAPNLLLPATDDLTIEYASFDNGKRELSLVGVPGTITSGAIPYLNTPAGKLRWREVDSMVDDVSLSSKLDKDWSVKFSIKGWSSQATCSADVQSMIVNPNDTNAGKHNVLCRYKDGDKWVLHYVPIGTDGLADEKTLTAKATVDGKDVGRLSVNGAYDSGNKDKALFSTGSGIEWKDVAGGAAVRFVGTDGGDGVVVGSGSTTNTVTFASASDSNVKVTVAKEGDGVKVTIGVYYK